MIFRGFWVFCWMVFLVLWFVMVACPFFAVRVSVGLKPMNEYWAIFCGPCMDSSRYAVWGCFWIWVKISVGWFLRFIFMIFGVLAGAGWVGSFWVLPKMIPHVCIPLVRKHTIAHYLRLISTKTYMTTSMSQTSTPNNPPNQPKQAPPKPQAPHNYATPSPAQPPNQKDPHATS